MKLYIVKKKDKRTFTYWDIFADTDVFVDDDEELFMVDIKNSDLVRVDRSKKAL
jgi:sugar lactone lactonase YvrE